MYGIDLLKSIKYEYLEMKLENKKENCMNDELKDLDDIMYEINKQIFKETGDIRAEILIFRHELRNFERELCVLFDKSLDMEDDEIFEKIHDHYAQIYLETKNFVNEIKGELENKND